MMRLEVTIEQTSDETASVDCCEVQVGEATDNEKLVCKAFYRLVTNKLKKVKADSSADA